MARQWLQSTDSCAFSSSNASGYAKLWKHLWKANIPPKVKNFTWRVCHNIFPTKVNLKRKGVRVEPKCRIYQGEQEVAKHVIFTCSFAKVVWFSSPLGLRGFGSSCFLLKEWMLEVLERREVDFEFSCMMLWRIWQERNARVWKESNIPPMVVW